MYWLDVSVELVESGPANVQFGWKTRVWPEHYNDDAVIGPEPWRELRYPPGHPYSETGAESSIDLAFALTSIRFLNGDFNQDGQLTVIDIDMLTAASAAGNHDPWYDVNVDQLADVNDIRIWVKILKNTWIRDANVDGMFNSGDMVQVFVRGKYEKPVAAVWSEGDWDGSGLFDSSDLVAAFADGGYEKGLAPVACGQCSDDLTGQSSSLWTSLLADGNGREFRPLDQQGSIRDQRLDSPTSSVPGPRSDPRLMSVAGGMLNNGRILTTTVTEPHGDEFLVTTGKESSIARTDTRMTFVRADTAGGAVNRGPARIRDIIRESVDDGGPGDPLDLILPRLQPGSFRLRLLADIDRIARPSRDSRNAAETGSPPIVFATICVGWDEASQTP